VGGARAPQLYSKNIRRPVNLAGRSGSDAVRTYFEYISADGVVQTTPARMTNIADLHRHRDGSSAAADVEEIAGHVPKDLLFPQGMGLERRSRSRVRERAPGDGGGGAVTAEICAGCL